MASKAILQMLTNASCYTRHRRPKHLSWDFREASKDLGNTNLGHPFMGQNLANTNSALHSLLCRKAGATRNVGTIHCPD